MDGFWLFLAYLMAGIGLGAGVDYFCWQRKFKRAGEEVKAKTEAMQQSFDERLQENASELQNNLESLRNTNEQLAALESRLRDERSQREQVQEKLEMESRQRAELAAENSRIPELEASLAAREDSLAQLRQTREDLQERLAALEQEMAEERKSLQECLIHVQGNHYLPGSVVRKLTRMKAAASSEAAGE